MDNTSWAYYVLLQFYFILFSSILFPDLYSGDGEGLGQEEGEGQVDVDRVP